MKSKMFDKHLIRASKANTRVVASALASGGATADAAKVLALFKKHFPYIRVGGYGSSIDVVFTIEVAEGLYKRATIAAFAKGLGIDPKKVTL